MDKLRIRGGRPLSGSVRISGAKNAVLPALAASILTDEWIELSRVPDVRDVRTMARVLEHLGAEVVEQAIMDFGIDREAPAPWRADI